MIQSSSLERTFDTLWRQLEGPPLAAQVPFHRFHFDRAHIATRVVIELDGGTWAQGQHVRGKGYSTMCRKNNRALLEGWVIFRLTTDMLAESPAQHLQPIIDYIRSKEHANSL